MSNVLPLAPLPDFRSPAFLRRHIADTMAFYHPHAIDPDGGDAETVTVRRPIRPDEAGAL